MYELLIIWAVIDILNFMVFSKGKWYALDILTKLEKRRFKDLKPVQFTWLFAKMKLAVYIAMAFAYWVGSNSIFGAFQVVIIGIVVSSTFLEDLGYHILNKEKIPMIWKHVWISQYIRRTPRSLIIFISMIGQIIAISIALM